MLVENTILKNVLNPAPEYEDISFFRIELTSKITFPFYLKQPLKSISK